MAMLVLYLFQVLFQLSQALNCPENAIEYGPSTCILILSRQSNMNGRQVAENECLLQKPLNQWKLPKVDSYDKVQHLRLAITKMTGHSEYWFWLGLRRDTPQKKTEVTNMTAWGDKSKWHWTDGTSLQETFPNAPWKPWMEPDNGYYQTSPSKKPEDLELCAVSIMYPRALLVYPYWFDKPCELYQRHLTDELLITNVLVCESTTGKPDTTNKPTDTKGIYSSHEYDPSEQQWLFGSVIMATIGLAFIAVIFGLFNSADKFQDVVWDEEEEEKSEEKEKDK